MIPAAIERNYRKPLLRAGWWQMGLLQRSVKFGAGLYYWGLSFLLTARTLPAAISRNANTISRLSESMRGFAPLRSCFDLCTANKTSEKRLGTCVRQSSNVIRATGFS